MSGCIVDQLIRDECICNDAGGLLEFGVDCITEDEFAATHNSIFCSAVDEPVCGCDGKTYVSACIAADHGVEVVSDSGCFP